jgi:hypothetical protein
MAGMQGEAIWQEASCVDFVCVEREIWAETLYNPSMHKSMIPCSGVLYCNCFSDRDFAGAAHLVRVAVHPPLTSCMGRQYLRASTSR